MMRIMAVKLDKLSATLGKILRARGFERSINEYRIRGVWGKSVGDAISRHAQPQSLHGKKLTVLVDSPAWMQQLSLLKPEIIKKLNEALGKDPIKDITLKLGEVSSPKKVEKEKVSSVRGSLTAQEHAEIEILLGDLAQPDIREAMRQLIEKDFLSKRK